MDAHKFSIMRTIRHELKNSSKWIFGPALRDGNFAGPAVFQFDNGFGDILLGVVFVIGLDLNLEVVLNEIKYL